MTEKLKVRIELMKWDSYENSQWLQKLNSHLQKELEVTSDLEMTKDVKNAMDGGLAMAISIASLALTALGTLFEIIKFHIEQKRDETLTIVGDGYTREISGLTKDEVEAIARDIEAKNLRELVIKVGD
jgi:hypothetical protein